MSEEEIAAKQAIVRKFILTAPPCRLPSVLQCLRTLASSEDSPAPSWFDEGLPAFAMEHCLNSLVVLDSDGSQSKLMLSEFNHVDSVLRTCIDQYSCSEERAEIEEFFRGVLRKLPNHVKSNLLLSTVVDSVKGEFTVIDSSKQRVCAATPMVETAQTPEALRKFLRLWKSAGEMQNVLQECATAILLPMLSTAAVSAVSVFPVIDAGCWNSESVPMKFALCISVARLNESAMWSVCWTSQYLIEQSAAGITAAGQSAARVHYFENCNVQMETKNKAMISIEGASLAAEPELVLHTVKKLMKKVKREEARFQQQIADVSNSVGDDALKALRRKLPVSKQLFDFSEATNSAAAVLASRRASTEIPQ